MEQTRTGRLCVEDASYRVYFVMAKIIGIVCNQHRWENCEQHHHRAALEDLEADLDKGLAEEVNRMTWSQESVPADGPVLRSLYSIYDLGRTAIKFSAYLSRRDPNGGDAPRRRFAESGRMLVNMVIGKSSIIKKRLDEGGWIDNVLESLVQVDRGMDTVPVGEALKKVVDEDFMEEWAGQVVESWREAATGFSYFKPEL